MKSTCQEFGLEQIQISAVFPRIDPDRLGNFKQIAGKMLDITRSDPGNLQYDWFLTRTRPAARSARPTSTRRRCSTICR